MANPKILLMHHTPASTNPPQNQNGNTARNCCPKIHDVIKDAHHLQEMGNLKSVSQGILLLNRANRAGMTRFEAELIKRKRRKEGGKKDGSSRG